MIVELSKYEHLALIFTLKREFESAVRAKSDVGYLYLAGATLKAALVAGGWGDLDPWNQDHWAQIEGSNGQA